VADSFDVIVVGGGPGGYACAIRAAQLGCSTAVVERDKLGGVCVNVGCIPTKALLHSAHVAGLIRRDAKSLGIGVGDVTLNLGAAVKRSRRVSDQNSKGVGLLLGKNDVTVIPGDGVLLGDRKVQVAETVYTAKKALVLATGSRVKGVPQIGLDINGESVITSDEALFLEEVPETLAVVGAGAVGMEFADIFNAFGSKVTIIEMLPHILPLEDAECADAVAKSYKRRRIDMIVGARITNAEVTSGKVKLAISVDGEARELEVDKVLLAAGRALNLEGIGLESAGVNISENGFVQVDAELQTTAEGVYCIGDIAGPPMLAHKATREGVFVAETIAGEKPHAISYDNIPSVTYCNPEVASAGLTEEQCSERSLDYTVGRFPLASNGRARASKETDGFVKIICDTNNGKILGGHIVASHASELIPEIVLAREYGHTAEELDLAVHAHPTLSEATAEAALDAMGRAIHL
jgi:dihydrolipoamide dehydrogenase